MRAYRCLNCRATCTTFKPFVPSCGRCGSGPAWMKETHSDEPAAPLKVEEIDRKMLSGGETGWDNTG